ncbi:glutamate receptor ionotropic, delta-2-like [Panulirus ornatus]|uniref:glutamate receptor ionotropic, delta-2-like n=1 Tax=Panulirus ornatus TaxID=150431 RepID=UPI003A878CD3
MASTRPLIKVAAEEWVPWTKLTTDEEGNVFFSGFMRNILDILSEMIEFDYELLRPPDKLWGIKSDNGSWSGMIGMLHREEVEFAIGPFLVTPDRSMVSDFSEPVYIDNQALVMIRPGLKSDVAGFIKPFTSEVWLLILLSLLSISFTMACMVKAEGEVFQTSTKNVATKIFTWVLQTVTQESSHWLPRKDGGRVLVVTWLLASLVFMSSYSGILTAKLTLPRITIPIDSLDDLVAQSDLPWRLAPGSYIFLIYPPGHPIREKLVKGMIGTRKNCWQSREGITKGEFATICHEVAIKKVMSWDFSTSGDCHLYIGKKKVYTNAILALALKKNSTYLPKFNKIVRRLMWSGILEHWLRSQLPNASHCLRPPGVDRREGVSALSLYAFGGTLFVLLGGMTLGALIFIFEHMIFCVWQRHDAKMTQLNSHGS